MRLVSAVPIIPSQEMSASVGWYRDIDVKPWGSTEFGVLDIDDNLITLFGFEVVP